MYSLVKGAATASLGLLMAVTIPAQPPGQSVIPQARAAAREPGQAPDLPRVLVDPGQVPAATRTIHVKANGDLQKALYGARGGDHILLEPGATYQGPFRLPTRDTQSWVVIASSAIGRGLPPAGHRVDRSHAPSMPRLVSSSGPVFATEPGAHHYRFVGLEIAPADGVFLREVVRLGGDERELSALPHHLVIDRCYIHGDPKVGSRRGVALNAAHAAVVDSYLADFKEVGADSQAIGGWNGAGPFRIANNYLEAAGENVMFGGADPAIENLVPSDIEVVHNHMTKPLAWRVADEAQREKSWSVKNLFELKNARRVLIEGNLLEYNWPHSQNGFAILFTPRNQDGKSPWSTVEDVTFTNNLVRHVAAGINILGRDDIHSSQRLSRIAIRNNLFEDVGGEWGNGRLFQLLEGTVDVTIDHNTAFQTDSIVWGGDHAPHTRFVFRNNIVFHNERGIIASGTGPGTPTLTQYFPGAVVRRNVVIGGNADHFPADNYFPGSLADLGFVPTADNDLRLTVARRFARAATDGRDPGADLEAITRALRGMTVIKVRNVTRTAPRRSFVGAALAAAPLMAGRTPGRPLQDGEWAYAAFFWAACLLLAYVYFGYPVVARVRAALNPQPRIKAPIEPRVSIVVVAHNEEDTIEAKIENLLSLDYPRNRLEIFVGSDGSTDSTVERARRYEHLGVKVHAFMQRRGKPAVINGVVPSTHGEIVVFADARQRFDANAVRALVANFADPSAGVVSGCLTLEEKGAAGAGQGSAFYWRYERLIRATESKSGSCVGATGAIYAIRRELFEPIPDDTLLDDVLVPLGVVRRGYRVLFEPEAKAYDSAVKTAHQEYTRKVRTIAGTFQLFARVPWLLNPWKNPLWFETVSHKGLRLALPLLHASVFVASLALVQAWWLYQLALAGQAMFYAAALAGCWQRNAKRRLIFLMVPYTICLLCWATVAGFLRFVSNRQQVTWERALPASQEPQRLSLARALRAKLKLPIAHP